MFLKASHIDKFYLFKPHFYQKSQKNWVLKDFNLELKEGENLLLYGESGCGKSTLGRILAMIESINAGEIYFQNKDLCQLNKLPPAQRKLLRKEIQYVFQDQKLVLNPYKKVSTLLSDSLVNFKEQVHWEEIYTLCETFEFHSRLFNLKPSQLSGGEASRLGLIRSLLLKPKLLICDEITSSLDLITAQSILRFLQKYQQSHPITYLFISHQESLYKHLSQKQLRLQKILIK